MLSGGEIPALVVLEAVSRMVPGVLNKEESYMKDSFYNGLLDYPHYTRPEKYRGITVPEVIRSGNHREIEKWRREMAIVNTFKKRKDLLKKIRLSKEEKKVLDRVAKKINR